MHASVKMRRSPIPATLLRNSSSILDAKAHWEFRHQCELGSFLSSRNNSAAAEIWDNDAQRVGQAKRAVVRV